MFAPEQAPPDDWARKADDFQAALTTDKRTALAGQLHVAPEALKRIGTGWNRHLHAYTFPERAGNGRIIGIATRRPADGAKKALKRSKRGLVVPSELDRKQSLLIVEGPTDVAAALTVDLQAVGRPSARGGIVHLAEMLTDWPGELIVVGEHDQKPDGSWPGRDGAKSVAGALARRLGRPIAWALPPDGVKDLREWITLESDGAKILTSLRERGAVVDGATAPATDEGESKRGPSQSTLLVQIAGDAELFHDGDTPYATVPVGEHVETWAVRSKGFKRWLARQFHKQDGRTPASQPMQDALAVVEGRALFDCAERPVFVRIGHANGAVYLDLCDRGWRVVKIMPDGWKVLPAADAPVRFRRSRGMLGLPMPERGGSLNELRRFVNLSDDGDFVLIVAWLIGALQPRGPYPLLAMDGEHGSAKSFTCRELRQLIDPNEAELRSEPRDERDLVIAATNGWLIALDNLSRVRPWLSDALSRISTGGGFATRELYTDAEEIIFSAKRPIVLNGITELATRSDLLDRAIVVTLPAIAEAERRDEAALWGDFEAARPRLLGALLTAVSAALHERDSVYLDRLPRMADFAKWVTGAEQGGGVPWRAGEFMAVYSANRAAAVETAIEASVVGPALLQFMAARTAWTGTATELLAELEAVADDSTKRARGWPKTGRGVSGALRRLAPNLRAVGLWVTYLDRETDRKRTRLLRIDKTTAEPSKPSTSSVDPATKSESPVASDGRGRSRTVGGRLGASDRPHKKPALDSENGASDGADDADDCLQAQSGPTVALSTDPGGLDVVYDENGELAGMEPARAPHEWGDV